MNFVYLYDTVKYPIIFKGVEYNVAISCNPVTFNIKEIVLNPIVDKYPVSFLLYIKKN